PNTSSTFVWKLSPEGQLLWVYEPHGQSSYPALAVRPDGVVLLGSENQTNLDLDPGPGLVRVGDYDSFLLELDPQGHLVWAVGFGAAPNQAFNASVVDAAAFDASGNIYVTGNSYGTVDVDPKSGTHYLTCDVHAARGFVLKLDPTASLIWADAFGPNAHTNSDTEPNAVAVDARGDVIMVGSFYGSGDFDPGPGTTTLTSKVAGSSDIFVGIFDKAGNLLGAQRAGGSDYDSANDVAVGPAGTATFVGSYSYPADFRPNILHYNRRPPSLLSPPPPPSP